MRAIYKIARLELSNLFYSPVAWLLIVILVFMMGSMFTKFFEGVAQYKELDGDAMFYAMSEQIFYGDEGIWKTVKLMLFFIMPLLTMGMISQEFNRGSIKLLFSSPISSLQIILGKYLGMMLYGLTIMGVLMFYVLIAWGLVDSFEWQAVLTGLLGLFLLLGFYAALGLFMSTLTTYQIVAALGMLVMLAFLGVISEVGQEYAFVREVTYWLAIGNRTNNFIKGLIGSEDVLYFVILSCMFLEFAILKMQLKRERCSFLNKTVRYLGVFMIAMLLGYFTSRPVLKFYHDSTFNKINTLTQASQDIVSKLDGGLTITTYVNLMDMNYSINHKRITRDMARYERFVRFKPEMKLKYVFYYYMDTTSRAFNYYFRGKTWKDAVEDQAKLRNARLGRFLTIDEVQKEIDLSDEGYRFVSLIERENGEKTFLRTFYDSRKLPSEIEISAALKRVAMKLPRVGFVSDHGARSVSGDRNRDYSYMMAEKTNRQALINQGFDIEKVYLGRNERGLDSLDVLVVAEPLEPFSEVELDALKRYIESGRNLIVAGKPKTDMYLQPVMDMLGVHFEEGILVQHPKDDYPVNLLSCRATLEAGKISRFFKRSCEIDDNFTMPGAAALKVVENKGFKTIPVLISRDSACWNERQTIDFVNEVPCLDPCMGEQVGVKTIMLALNRECHGRDQRIIVVGDADCFSMGELSALRRNLPSSNRVLIDAMFDWLSYEELPVNTVRPGKIDNNFTLSYEAASAMTIALKWILPALILAFGVVVLIRRKGK